MGSSTVFFWVLSAIAVALGLLVLALMWRGKTSKFLLTPGCQPPEAAPSLSYLQRCWQFMFAYVHGIQSVVSASNRTRYAQSWVLLMGQAGAGKSSLAASLKWVQQYPQEQAARVAGVPDTTWYTLAQGKLIDPSGLIGIDTADEAQQATWRSVLRGVLHLRPERAIDGVVLVVSARSLLNDSAQQQLRLACQTRQQLDALRDEFNLIVPVSVVVSQCDSLAGFTPFWQYSTAKQREGIFGWSARGGIQSDGAAQWAAQAFEQIGRKLTALQIETVTKRFPIGDADAFFLFTRQFDRLHGPLRAYLTQVFEASVHNPPHECRGLYFTGCVATAEPAPSPVRSDVSFVEDLTNQKMDQERGLVRATRTSIWSRDLAVRNTQRSVVTAAGLLLLALGWSALTLERKVEGLRTSMVVLQQSQAIAQVQDQMKEVCTSKVLLDEVLNRAAAMDTDLAFVTMPWSWLDSRPSDNATQVVSNTVMARTVFPALACALQERAKQMDEGLTIAGEPTLAGIVVKNSAYAKTRFTLKTLALEIRQLEDKLQSFARLTAIPADSPRVKLDKLNQIYTYLYGSGLPAAAARANGVVAQSLAQVPYSGWVTVPARMRITVTQQLTELTEQLQIDLLKEVGLGPILLSTLNVKKSNAPVDDTRRLTAWLTWVEKAWVPTDPLNNPCTSDAHDLRSLLMPLVKDHGYTKTLMTNTDRFGAAQCYDPALKMLRGMQMSPYGPLLMPLDEKWGMNPKLSTEVRGLTALLSQSYMQISNPLDFECNSVAVTWSTPDLGKALNYANEYQAFAQAQGLTPMGAPAKSRPLFDRLASAQLEYVMNDAMRTSQLATSPAPMAQGLDAVSVLEQQLLQQSGDFSKALDPLLGNLRLYTQLGFSASGPRVTQCARDYASSALSRVASLVLTKPLYEPEAGPEDGLLVNLGSTAMIRNYLERQAARAQAVTRLADPFVNLLRNTDGVNDAQRDKTQTSSYWSNTINELTRYVQFKDPNGQVGTLDTFFYKTLADMSYANCAKTLAAYQAPAYEEDMFSDLRKKLMSQINLRCVNRRVEQATTGYRKLAERFNNELAGHYPFAALNSRQGDASVAAAKNFLNDYAAQREGLQSALLNLDAPPWVSEARTFLAQLDEVEQLLGGGLGVNGATQPIKLDVTFRVQPQTPAKPGSEQLVSWVLSSGQRVISYPGTKPAMLDWNLGQLLLLDLHWAEGSKWRPASPANVSEGSGYSAKGNTASFSDVSDWSLLRMVERQKPTYPVPADPKNPQRVLLEFKVPTVQLNTSSSADKSELVTVYLGLNVSSTDPKSQASVPLSWPKQFPKKAPLPTLP